MGKSLRYNEDDYDFDMKRKERDNRRERRMEKMSGALREQHESEKSNEERYDYSGR